jgi:NADH dehydrogenase
LWAARAFARTPFQVLLIDRNNYHTFLPLLYQVAAAEIEPEEIIYPVRSILRPLSNVDFLLADVQGIDFAARTLRTGVTTIPYDYLILAAGSATHFYGVAGAVDHALTLKTLDDAVRLRNHILCNFERAVTDSNAQRRRRRLTFAIVGGGPTGVEYAGALAELLRGPLKRDFPKLDPHEGRVVLVESADCLLPSLPGRLGRYALRRLGKMGVEVRLQTVVDRVDAEEIYFRDGTSVPAETTVWTAGVRGEPTASNWGLPMDRSGRVAVDPTLEVQGLAGVYAIGDLAHSEANGKPLPMIAPVALQQGVLAAKNIRRRQAEMSALPFQYRDHGMMATIGRNAAVASIGGWAFTGFPAWLAWLGVHLIKLIGFRNRLFVLVNWAWDYFLFERMVRLILPSASCRDPF